MVYLRERERILMSTQYVTFGRIIHVNAETGMLGIETRIGERLLVKANTCEAETCEVAVLTHNGRVYSIVSLATWADLQDADSSYYKLQGVA